MEKVHPPLTNSNLEIVEVIDPELDLNATLRALAGTSISYLYSFYRETPRERDFESGL
jgi:hypothetical protein